MTQTIRSKLALVAVAFGALCAVQAAQAHTDVYFSVGVPAQPAPVYVGPAEPVYMPAPQVVYPAAPTVYVTPGYGYGSPWEQRRAWREAQWREQQWREQQWRQQQWRQQQWREHEGRERQWHERDDRHDARGSHRGHHDD